MQTTDPKPGRSSGAEGGSEPECTSNPAGTEWVGASSSTATCDTRSVSDSFESGCAEAESDSSSRARQSTSRPRRRSWAHRARFEPLAKLLDDDTPLVREAVRREYERASRMGLPSLRRAAKGESPVARARARTLMLER